MTRAGWALVALIGLATACNATPQVPADAALPLVARSVLQGDMTPDATEGVDPETLPRSPAGDDCLQIEGPAGPMTLCWGAYRDTHDSDPDKDYYRLIVHGIFGGGTGTGVRWVALRARLVGAPADDVFEVWPKGVYEGPCEQVDVALIVGPPQIETLCGRTEATSSRETWSHRVTWTCVGCVIADHADRSIALHEFVAVAAGTVPTWEIYADLGS